MKKIVLYSSNSKRRSADSGSKVYPSWGEQWDTAAARYPDYEITLVVQLNGRYFLDIEDGKLVTPPSRIKVVPMDMESKTDDFVKTIAELKPDVVIAMPGPVSGYDWNGIRDAVIADELRSLGFDVKCYSVETALDCFDKWRTYCVLKEHGFKVAESLYIHHEMFVTEKFAETSTGNVYKEYILTKIRSMPMPVVIKSTTGASSIGIFIAKSFEEAKEYLESDAFDGDAVVQQKLKGEEYGAEVHGSDGSYFVTPPFRIFNTAKAELNDPFGSTTIKYGPITDEEHHPREFMAELKRMADVMGFSGIMQIDFFLVDGEWYVLEINSRWSGITTLTTAARGKLPYEVYLDEVSGEAADNDINRLSYACQFKMNTADPTVLEQISREESIKSIISYEIILPGREKTYLIDTVIGGYRTLNCMLESFRALQQKYPDAISAGLVSGLEGAIEGKN